MTSATLNDVFPRLARRARRLAIIAAVVAVVLVILQPRTLAAAWFYAIFVIIQPALGSLILLLIYRMTGGQWGRSLQPFLLAGTELLPFIWALLLPLLFLPDLGMATGDRAHPATGTLAVYESRAMLVVRYLVIGAVLTLVAWGARRAGSDTRLRWVAPVGFIVLVFALHLAAVDWLFSLEPGWFSTGFPLIWMGGHAVSGLSAAIAFGIATGRPASAAGTSGRPEGIDWGNLLLAAVLFWSYVAFVHLLIIWMGNIAIEITWYVDRATPGWGGLIAAIALFHLFLPLLMLFFRAFKRSSRALGALAAGLLVFQALHTCWLIFPSIHPGTMMLVVASVFAIAALAGFFSFYVRLASQRLEVP